MNTSLMKAMMEITSTSLIRQYQLSTGQHILLSHVDIIIIIIKIVLMVQHTRTYNDKR